MQVKKDVTIDELIQRAESYCSDSNLSIIKNSFSFAKQAHQGQTRMTGKPYIKHPLAVAYILADMGLEPPMICAALMHDVIEDTDRTYDAEIISFYGRRRKDYDYKTSRPGP
ncbi:MAG: hypothetical protein BRC22_02925 [Parcubacteria group bacterium QH_9_35_7]|nr:MAG: hypothetical protein BRC22_02925 [Parcubacteria group bacterium QH_9_35_7]